MATPSCNPDHNDVTELSMNMLQMSNGTTQFTCNICNTEVVKSTMIKSDVEFTKKYKRYYKMCVDHVENRKYIPTSKDDDGDLSCNWCGEKLPEVAV